MTTAQRPVAEMPQGVRDAIVDQLRACQTSQEILAFEARYNNETESEPLYAVICEFLHNRSISRALAAKWLRTLLCDRENRLR